MNSRGVTSFQHLLVYGRGEAAWGGGLTPGLAYSNLSNFVVEPC